jgi:hypothetical protein
MLNFLYRLKAVLTRGWEQHRLIPVSGNLIISELEWGLIEQLLALFGLVNNFNRAMTLKTVSISKVYPHLVILFRSLASTQLSCPGLTIPSLAGKMWEHDIDDSITALKQLVAMRIEVLFPLVNCQRTLDKWGQSDLDRLEPYLVSMAVDPMISSNYFLFRSPHLNDQANHAIYVSLKEYEMMWLQQAVGKLHSQFNGASRMNEQSLLSASESYLHHASGRAMVAGIPADEGLYGAAPKSFGGSDDVGDEANELFQLHAYHALPFDNPLEPLPARHLRNAWEDGGGWATYQKSVELLWWEKHCNIFPCMSKVAAAYLAIPATTYGMTKFASPDGPQSIMGCMGYSPTSIEKTLFIRENFYNGLLDVQITGISAARKRKRANKSTGGMGDFSSNMIEVPDHNRQQPPKYLHRLITSTVNLEGEVNWRTKVMKPTGDVETRHTVPYDMDNDYVQEMPMNRMMMSAPTGLPFQSSMNMGGIASGNIGAGSIMAVHNSLSTVSQGGMIFRGASHHMPELFDAYEWKLGMRHTIRLHLEAVRAFIVNSGYHFRVDNSCKTFEI